MKYIYTVLFAISSTLLFAQNNGDFQSSGNVSLNSATNWQKRVGGSWIAASLAPSVDALSGAVITILSGNTWGNNSAVSFSNNNITVVHKGLNGVFSTNNSNKISWGSNTYVHNTTALLADILDGSTYATATIVYRGTGTTTSSDVLGRTFYNLYLEASSGTWSYSFTTKNGNNDIIITNMLKIGAGVNADFNFSGGSQTQNVLDPQGDFIIDGNLTIHKPFTINAGKILELNNATIASLNFSGSKEITINGTVTTINEHGLYGAPNTNNAIATSLFPIFGPGSTVIYNGTTPQDITVQAYENLSIAGGSMKSLGGNISVNGTLNLLSGKIELANYTLTQLTGNIINANANNFLITGSYINSKFTKNGIAGQTLLPIGTINNYLPITVTPTGIANYTVSVFEGATTDASYGGTALSNKTEIVDAVYNIAASASNNTNIELGWQDNLEGTTFATFGNGQIGISPFLSAAWQTATATIADNTNNFVRSNFIIGTTNTPFAIGKIAVALPITLSNFGAIVKNSIVQVDWKAVSTSINCSFDIERSSSGNEFTKLGTINAKGIGSFDYQFIDNTPASGTSFYRLKITNEAGKVSYSKTVSINMDTKTFALTNVYPTVATNSLTLVIGSSTQRRAQLSIIDMNGRILENKAININSGNLTYPVNIAKLGNGSYVLLLQSGEQVLKTKFIKQ